MAVGTRSMAAQKRKSEIIAISENENKRQRRSSEIVPEPIEKNETDEHTDEQESLQSEVDAIEGMGGLEQIEQEHALIEKMDGLARAQEFHEALEQMGGFKKIQRTLTNIDQTGGLAGMLDTLVAAEELQNQQRVLQELGGIDSIQDTYTTLSELGGLEALQQDLWDQEQTIDTLHNAFQSTHAEKDHEQKLRRKFQRKYKDARRFRKEVEQQRRQETQRQEVLQRTLRIRLPHGTFCSLDSFLAMSHDDLAARAFALKQQYTAISQTLTTELEQQRQETAILQQSLDEEKTATRDLHATIEDLEEQLQKQEIQISSIATDEETAKWTKALLGALKSTIERQMARARTSRRRNRWAHFGFFPDLNVVHSIFGRMAPPKFKFSAVQLENILGGQFSVHAARGHVSLCGDVMVVWDQCELTFKMSGHFVTSESA